MADFPFVIPRPRPHRVLVHDGTTSKEAVGFPVVVDSFAVAPASGETEPEFEDIDLTDPQYEEYGFISNHCELAQDRLSEPFRQPNMRSVVCIWGERMQGLEQQLANLLLLRSLDTALGAQQDALGRLMGISRDGIGDLDFRVRLRARAKVIGSQQTAPSLLEVITILDDGNDPSSISYTPVYPAGFVLTFTVPQGQQLWGEQWVRDFLAPVTPSGVRGQFEFSERDTRIFTWAESPNGDPTPGIQTGWAEATPGSGGTWADVVVVNN